MDQPAAHNHKSDEVRLVKWLSTSGIVLAVAGIGVSIWLTIAHYTTSALLACPDTGLINCQKVTSSIYSSIFGVPLAVLGLGFFVLMLCFQLPVAWRSYLLWVRYGRLALAISGLLMIFWLVYVELFKLNAICLYCTTVHVLTLLLFLLTMFGTALTTRE